MPFQIQAADILSIRCDAIVNPTDEQLSGSGGLDAQIHAVAGQELRLDCDRLAPLHIGEAAMTPGIWPNSLFAIHTVAPRWTNKATDVLYLRQCYRNVLRLVDENDFESVVFPLIGSGTRGFPKELVLRVAVEEIGKYLQKHDTDIRLVIHDKSEFRPNPELLAGLDSYIDSVGIKEMRQGRSEARAESAAPSLP